jgi:hypothetical protein
MAFVLSDRIKETTTTTSTGTYTLGGAVSGFETFTANLSNGDTTYYCCTDGTDFEVGLGTFASSGTTLARTTIISSSNSNNAVNWSSGTRDIFCTLPGSKAVFKNGDGDVILADNEEIKLGADGDLVIRHAGSNSLIEDNGGGSLIVKADPVFLLEKSGTSERMILANADGSVELYHNNVKKLETRSGGVTITGNLQFAETHSSDSNTQIFTETESTNNQQTNLIIQAGDDASNANEDSVTIRHKNFGNATPQDLDMAIFKRNVSDNSKADITFNGDLTLLSTDAGATAAPTLSLYRNSASPANSDDIGQIQWFAENDADEKIEYARIDVKNSGVTDGAEYGQMDFMVQHNGSEMIPLRLSFNLVQFYRDLYIGAAYKIQFEGNAYNDFETSLTVAGPTADRTITLPDATGTVALTASPTFTGTLTTPSIRLDATGDVSPSSTSHPFQVGASNTFNIAMDSNEIMARNNGGNAPLFLNIEGGLVEVGSGGLGLRGGNIIYEGGTNNDHETTLTVVDPTADRTITFPDASGTVLTTGNSDTPTTTTSSSDADFVLVDDGGTMKKITPSNLGITSGGASKGFAVAMAIAL